MKCGETWCGQLPILEHFSICMLFYFFGMGRGLSKFSRWRIEIVLLASVCGISPFWFTGIWMYKPLIKCSVYPQNSIDILASFAADGNIARMSLLAP